MDEQQEIFTPEQFRVQAAELRAAVAELRRRDEQLIDPQNPFENETEFLDYNQDYGDVVPQIRIPQCMIPVRPNKREKKRVRHYYNIAGTGLLFHMILSNALAIVFMLVYYALQAVIDGAAAGGELPSNYDLLLEEYFMASSANTAMNTIVFLICNVGVALFGLKWARIPVSGLFQTKGLTPAKMLSYICIAIGLQSLCGYLAAYITEFMSAAGVTAYDPDFSTGQDIKNVILMSVYGCIVAPITEELLFRGMVLKNLSRVSQRFGIIASAVLFGVWHENIGQFVLAFFVGVFMGYLTVKHNSLVPAILCHMAVNTASQLFDIAYTYGWLMMYTVLDYIYMGIVVIGAVLLIRMLIRERLPYTTPHQAERGLRIAVTSIPLVIVTAAHIVASVVWIMESTAGNM